MSDGTSSRFMETGGIREPQHRLGIHQEHSTAQETFEDLTHVLGRVKMPNLFASDFSTISGTTSALDALMYELDDIVEDV